MRAPERALDPPDVAPACAWCRKGRDEYREPWAESADRNGEVCSPACSLRDRLRYFHAPDDGRNRVAAIQEALMEGVEIERLRLRVNYEAECRTVTGDVAEASRFGLDLEEVGPDGARQSFEWASVEDAEVIGDA